MTLASILNEGHKKVDESGLGFTGAAPAPGNSARLAREYFDSLTLELRVVGAVKASTRASFFGVEFSTPVMVAALSALNSICPNGMVEVAKAAAAANALMWVGIGGEDELKAIVDTGAKAIKIIKPYQDHDLIFKKLEQAERCGALAVGMDVCFGLGMKNGFTPAPMSLKDIDVLLRFIKATNLPFILKGVLSEHDAKNAVTLGAAGIVVSHSGGTVLDYLVPPAKVLPRIRALLGKKAGFPVFTDAEKKPEFPVFFDGGIASGLDAFKALALGADGVCVGKAVMAGLAADGADGVQKILEGFTSDVQRAMSLTGAWSVSSIDPEVIWGAR